MARGFEELMRRRVPHVLGLYLAAGWGVLEFTDWVMARFGVTAPVDTAIFVAGCVALPAVGWAAWRLGASRSLPPLDAPPRSVAVLPFVTVGGDPDAEFLGFGIADQILSDLTRVEDLHVVARTSSFALGAEPGDVRAVGRKLGARAVLEGSIQRAGQRLRVTTQLINAEDGYHLWSERYDRTMEDVFRIQDEIASNVARVLEAVLREHERRAMSKVYTHDVEAWEFYLRGRRFFLQTRLRSLRFARDMFTRAIELDEDFALAYAGLADVAAMMATYYPAAAADLSDALEASRRALSLDPELAEAHSAHGAVLSVMGDLPAAEAAFRRATVLDPRLYEARYFHARACFQQGRFEEAVSLFREASAVREDYSASFFAAQSLEAMGEHQKARQAYEEALDVVERHMRFNPDDARAATMRSVALCRLGRVEEGLSWADRALAMDAEDAGVRYNAACLFAVAGKTDRAMECLEEAMAVGFGNIRWLEHDPDLDSLRGDPRFTTLMAHGSEAADAGSACASPEGG
jgi:adenylate cyclase